MANRGIELNGVQGLLDELRKRAASSAKRVESNALKAAGEVMAQDMRQRAPRSDTDRKYHLQDNITVSSIRRKDGVVYVLVGPNKKVGWRAHFVEFGTSRQGAEPFVQPAFRAKSAAALQAIADELRKGLGG